MKFKLSKLNLFLIIIFVIVLSTLGFTIKEHFDNATPGTRTVAEAKNKRVGPTPNLGLSYGKSYDPFENEGIDPFLDNDYSKTIAGLEDKIVSGRGNKNDSDKILKVKQEDAKTAQSAGIDLSKYVLKSEIVPPVCPKCPDSRSCPRPKPCPACPPCARCPEPSFECKKVPNYNAINASSVNGNLPMPQLNSFSTFN